MVPKSDEITDARANLVTGKQNTADNTSVQQVTHYGNFDNQHASFQEAIP